jgi:ferredoxin
MPNVTFTNWNKTVRAGPLSAIRTVAQLAGISLYNGLAKVANCHGAGLCGTCTVHVEPQAGLTPPTSFERMHGCTGPFRLSCQARVADARHDLLVTKHEGHRGKGRMPVKVDGARQAAPASAART